MSTYSVRNWPPSLKRLIIRRDNAQCRVCGKGTGKLEIDHVKPIRLGGARLDPRNLQLICVGCHIAKTRGEYRHNPPIAMTPGRKAWNDLTNELLNSETL